MNPKHKIQFARQLRSNPTPAENHLWQRLRKKQLGVKFRRQRIIAPYIADFTCLEKRLVVEVDGYHHANSMYDKIRDQYINDKGYDVMRFWNSDVLVHTNSVVEAIFRKLHGSPHPNLPPLAGEGTRKD